MFEQLDLPAFIKSLLVHLGVIGLLFFSWKTAEDAVLPKSMPQHVTAMIVEKPKAQEPQKPVPQPKKPEPKKPEPKKPEPKKPEPKKPEPKKPEAKKPDPRKKPEPKKPEPKKPEPKSDSVDFSDILQSEMKQLEKQPKPAAAKAAPTPATSAATSDKEQDEVQEFLGLIQQTISRNWIRPPSARTGMVVTLRINLLPGGELNDVNVIESSGNPAFDRSAMAAVQKAGRFPVPSDPGKFDRYFRSLKLRFNPEDLRY